MPGVREKGRVRTDVSDISKTNSNIHAATQPRTTHTYKHTRRRTEKCMHTRTYRRVPTTAAVAHLTRKDDAFATRGGDARVREKNRR